MCKVPASKKNSLVGEETHSGRSFERLITDPYCHFPAFIQVITNLEAGVVHLDWTFIASTIWVSGSTNSGQFDVRQQSSATWLVTTPDPLKSHYSESHGWLFWKCLMPECNRWSNILIIIRARCIGIGKEALMLKIAAKSTRSQQVGCGEELSGSELPSTVKRTWRM